MRKRDGVRTTARYRSGFAMFFGVIRAPIPQIPQNSPDNWEEDAGFDLGHVARLLFWGVLAVSSLGGAFLAARTDIGSERIVAAWNALTAPPAKQPQSASVRVIPPEQLAPSQQIAPAVSAPASAPSPAPSVSATEVHALAEHVQTLAAERDRLVARLDALERSLDVTGSIGTPERGPAEDRVWNSVPVPVGRPSYAPFGNMPPFTPEPVTDWVVSKTEFGIDLGTAPTLDGVRAQWAAVRAQHGALLEGLRPTVAIREIAGGGHELRLIAGPITNAAYAARICVVLSKSRRDCRATSFDGQRLATR